MTATCWTTREGKVLAIRDMADGHLGNTLRYLERRAQELDGLLYPRTPIYEALSAEAKRRGVRWRVGWAERCAFDECRSLAVMIGPPPEQEPRCSAHRQDALAYAKRACDGCLRTGVVFVAESPGGADSALLFCGDCATGPDGPFATFFAILLLVLTLGRVRL